MTLRIIFRAGRDCLQSEWGDRRDHHNIIITCGIILCAREWAEFMISVAVIAGEKFITP